MQRKQGGMATNWFPAQYVPDVRFGAQISVEAEPLHTNQANMLTHSVHHGVCHVYICYDKDRGMLYCDHAKNG